MVGFNQFFFGIAGEDVLRYGVAIDQQFTPDIHAGVEFSRREVETPLTIIGPPDQSFVFDSEEANGRAYLFWTPTPLFALRAELQYDELESEDAPAFGTTLNIETRRVPLGVSYFSPFGLSRTSGDIRGPGGRVPGVPAGFPVRQSVHRRRPVLGCGRLALLSTAEALRTGHTERQESAR